MGKQLDASLTEPPEPLSTEPPIAALTQPPGPLSTELPIASLTKHRRFGERGDGGCGERGD